MTGRACLPHTLAKTFGVFGRTGHVTPSACCSAHLSSSWAQLPLCWSLLAQGGSQDCVGYLWPAAVLFQTAALLWMCAELCGVARKIAPRARVNERAGFQEDLLRLPSPFLSFLLRPARRPLPFPSMWCITFSVLSRCRIFFLNVVK